MTQLNFKKYTTSLFLMIWSSLTLGCSPQAEKDQDHSKMAHSQHQSHKSNQPDMDHSQHQSMDSSEPSEMSVFNLDSNWTTQESKTIQLKSFQGKVQLFAMVYSSCQNACPRIIADMKKIESTVEKKYKNKVNLVLISIDPKVDTPQKLKELATSSHLSSNWKLLRGDEDDVLDLSVILGVKYKKISDTDYAHSNIISVLNQSGEIVHQQKGLGVSPEKTLLAIEKLL